MTYTEWMNSKNIAAYGPHLEPIIKLAYEAGQSDPTIWTCFHCGFQTSNQREARGHFGEMGEESALCLVWSELNADERANEFQNTAGQLSEEFEANCTLRKTVEGLEYRLTEFESLLNSRFKNCKTINDAYNLYDSMEGRALAAEEKLACIDAQLIEALALAKLAQEQSRKRSEAFATFDIRNSMPGPWPVLDPGWPSRPACPIENHPLLDDNSKMEK